MKVENFGMEVNKQNMDGIYFKSYRRKMLCASEVVIVGAGTSEPVIMNSENTSDTLGKRACMCDCICLVDDVLGN